MLSKPASQALSEVGLGFVNTDLQEFGTMLKMLIKRIGHDYMQTAVMRQDTPQRIS
jgi:hypothetical protein